MCKENLCLISLLLWRYSPLYALASLMILLHRSDPSEAIIIGFLTILLFYGDGVVSPMP
jgi:hypothetical protein